MITTNTATAHDDVPRLYRAIPIIVSSYEADLYDKPATYRWWLASGLLGVFETHTQVFAVTAPAPVVTFIIDPVDHVGAELFRHFEHRGDPLPARWESPNAGPHGPVVIVPCVEFYARRVLHAFDASIEHHIGHPPRRGRSWIVVAASDGVSVFDASISARIGEFDDTNEAINMVFEIQR